MTPTIPDTDYYALLAVAPSADAVAIRKAWVNEQRLWGTRQNAPDLAARHEAERHVQLLAEVRDVLLDPVRRAKYDLELAQRPAPAAAPPAAAVVAAEPPQPSVARAGGYASRHPETVSALGVGLVGGVLTGSQVFHWGVPLMVASVLWLCLPLLAFDVLGLRSVTWAFRNRARGFATWLVLIELTVGFGMWAVADLDGPAAVAAAVTPATVVPRPRTAVPTAFAPRIVATVQPTATGEIRLPDGLRYTDDRLGTGPVAQAGKRLFVHYSGWLMDGTLFDSTLSRNQPFSFLLGRGEVLKGWDEGVAGMKVGGKRTLIVPGELGYGASGALDVIPPNATLRYEVELLDVR